MLPYKKNVSAYVAKMLADDGSSVDELTPPELEQVGEPKIGFRPCPV